MLGRQVAIGSLALLVALLAINFFGSESCGNDGDGSVVIPLDKVWAFQMPETRDVGELEQEKPLRWKHGPLVGQIRRSLSIAPPAGKEAKAGFAVLGTGIDALPRAHEVICKGKARRKEFPFGSEISVVFFSYQFGSYVHLHRVEQRNNVIEVHYRFVPHRTREMTSHFALIPLGALPSGEYTVEIIQYPLDQQITDGGHDIICKPFAFSVIEQDK